MLEIIRNDHSSRAVLFDNAFVKPDCAGAETLHSRHVVTNENDGSALASDLAHFPEAFLLKLHVADGEHLVYNQDLGFQVGRHGKGQAHIHAAGISLDWRVQEL